jgi:Na+/melibiose symporter-like transporter
VVGAVVGAAAGATGDARRDAAPAERRVPWTPRLAYALGNAGETILHRTFEYFVLFFYTQVLGLAGSLAGLAILAALVVDAITDPLVGTYSDSLQARFGRRHTLMFASALPTALLFFLLFNPPAGLSPAGLGLWLAATAIGLRVAITFFYVPWSAQIAELTPDPRERVTLAILRNVFGAVAQASIIALAFNLFFRATPDFPRGQENPAAYAPFALAFGLGLGVVILLSAAGTYRRMRAIEAAETVAPVRFTVAALGHAWRDMMFGFPNFRCLFLGALFALTALSAFNAFALYLGSYFWELPTGRIGQWQLAFVVGAVVTFLAGKPIVDRTRPSRVFAVGLATGIASLAVPVLLKLVGVLGDDVDANFAVLCASNALAGFFLGLVMITSAVLASETSDEYERRRGVKGTAMLFGFITLSMKLASGLGKLLTGVAIDLIRLPAASEVASIAPQQLAALGWACFVVLAALGALGAWVFSGYRTPDARPALASAD